VGGINSEGKVPKSKSANISYPFCIAEHRSAL
jgi:hypothetical protein